MQGITADQEFPAPYYYVHACNIGGKTEEDEGGGHMTRNFMFQNTQHHPLNAICQSWGGGDITSHGGRNGGDMGEHTLRCRSLLPGLTQGSKMDRSKQTYNSLVRLCMHADGCSRIHTPRAAARRTRHWKDVPSRGGECAVCRGVLDTMLSRCVPLLCRCSAVAVPLST